MASGVVVEGLSEFRRAVRTAAGRFPRELPLALKKAGVPIVAQAAAMAPRLTGRLASGYKVSVSGTRASVVSSVPYAGGAEWGQFGKWSGFARYGPAPRFVGAALESREAEVLLIVDLELRDIIEAYGWFG